MKNSQEGSETGLTEEELRTFSHGQKYKFLDNRSYLSYD